MNVYHVQLEELMILTQRLVHVIHQNLLILTNVLIVTLRA